MSSEGPNRWSHWAWIFLDDGISRPSELKNCKNFWRKRLNRSSCRRKSEQKRKKALTCYTKQIQTMYSKPKTTLPLLRRRASRLSSEIIDFDELHASNGDTHKSFTPNTSNSQCRTDKKDRAALVTHLYSIAESAGERTDCARLAISVAIKKFMMRTTRRTTWKVIKCE